MSLIEARLFEIASQNPKLAIATQTVIEQGSRLSERLSNGKASFGLFDSWALCGLVASLAAGTLLCSFSGGDKIAKYSMGTGFVATMGALALDYMTDQTVTMESAVEDLMVGVYGLAAGATVGVVQSFVEHDDVLVGGTKIAGGILVPVGIAMDVADLPSPAELAAPMLSMMRTVIN